MDQPGPRPSLELRGVKKATTPRREWDIAWMAREIARQATQTRPATLAFIRDCRAAALAKAGLLAVRHNLKSVDFD